MVRGPSDLCFSSVISGLMDTSQAGEVRQRVRNSFSLHVFESGEAQPVFSRQASESGMEAVSWKQKPGKLEMLTNQQNAGRC